MLATIAHSRIYDKAQPRDARVDLGRQTECLVRAFIDAGLDVLCRRLEPGRWQAGLSLLENERAEVREVGYVLLLGAIASAEIVELSTRAAALREALLSTLTDRLSTTACERGD